MASAMCRSRRSRYRAARYRRLALFWLAEVLRATNDYARAQACLEEGRQLSQKLDDGFGMAFQVAALGRLASSQGDHARAIPLLRQALTLWRDLGDLRDVAVGLDGLALAATAQRNARTAARLFGAAAAVRERPDLTRNPIWEDDHARAVEATRASLGEAGFMAAWEAGRALPLELAIDEALSFAESQAPDAPPARLHAGAGLAGSRDSAGPTLLSRRERDVAVRIASGWSNQQIGADLHIARRTVESHITAILSKLGLTSRTQLALWAVEHGLRPPEGGS